MQNTNPLINPVVVLRKEFDDWAVLFNPDTAEAVGINPLGVFIWEQLENNRNIDQIVNAVRQEFTDVPDQVEDEITTFINNLAEHGFIGFEVDMTS